MTRYRAFNPIDPNDETVPGFAFVWDTIGKHVTAKHVGPDSLTHAEETARALNETAAIMSDALGLTANDVAAIMGEHS